MEEFTPGTHQQAWFRALDHARLLDVKPFWRVGHYYTVDSPRTGQRYEVHRVLTPGHVGYDCTCTAYAAGKVCWHRALVAALPYESELRKLVQFKKEAKPWEKHTASHLG